MLVVLSEIIGKDGSKIIITDSKDEAMSIPGLSFTEKMKYSLANKVVGVSLEADKLFINEPFIPCIGTMSSIRKHMNKEYPQYKKYWEMIV